MPRGDRTGPNGMGSMTGRGMGRCNGYEAPEFTRGVPRSGVPRGGDSRWGGGFGSGFGRGYGRGFGYGGGYGNQRFSNYPNYPVQQYSAKDETEYLENEIEALKNELKAMETHLAGLKKED